MKIILVIILFICTLCSCDTNRQLNILEEKSNQKHYVSLDNAFRVAESFMNYDSYSTKTRGGDLTVKETFEINGNNDYPLFHIINYKEGGFAIVSGDDRLEPILAYSDENDFDDHYQNYPEGILIWLNNFRRIKDYLDDKEIEQSKEIRFLWEKYSNPINTRSLDPESGIDPECDTIVGPLVLDSWHQDASYNDNFNEVPMVVLQESIDSSYFEVSYLKPVIGGLPLSIARIMHFWEFPQNYSWNSMSNNTADAYNKSLLYEIHNDIKGYAISNGYSFDYYSYVFNNGDYNITTNVDIDFPIDLYLKNVLNYTSATTINYSLNDRYIIRREIFDNLRPVILTGKYSNIYYRPHHTWLCDGYRFKFEHWYDENMNPIGVVTNKLHHRWGLGGSCDGWFSSSDMDAYGDGIAYGDNMKLTYEIHP